jgi:hypothetical protein
MPIIPKLFAWWIPPSFTLKLLLHSYDRAGVMISYYTMPSVVWTSFCDIADCTCTCLECARMQVIFLS